MEKNFKRREFIQAALASVAALSTPLAQAGPRVPEHETEIEALVIGSGFGGAVASLRLGEARVETIVLERGKRWPITPAGNTFSSIVAPDGRSTWLSPSTILPAPFSPTPIDVFTGVFDRKIGNGMTAYFGAGVGGGSLIYGAITIQPDKRNFYQVFPREVDYDTLDRTYYPRVKRMLAATPIPDDILASDAYLSSRLLKQQAEKAGLNVVKPDIAIDWNTVRDEMRGRRVASIIAGEVYYGTNSGAKNSLDRNYLRQAEETGYVRIEPLHVVTAIEEAGSDKYRVRVDEIDERGNVLRKKIYLCRYLFLAAGSVGTTELLVRARATSKLPRLNDTVGRYWGTNGDSNAVMVNGVLTNINLGSPGVVAVQDFTKDGVPLLLETFQALPLPPNLLAVLGLAITKPEGYFSYNRAKDTVELNWPAGSRNNAQIAKALTDVYNRLNDANGTILAAPIDQTFTAHPCGGAVIGQTCDENGEVFGCRNLFVMDGALIPGSAGCTNPSMTIAALAEHNMDRFLDGRHGR
ncbi:GMC oxidoreductase [Paraburkholderia humisilvae]|uniref:Cholesterol oxidase n=1 Tax=Paraburkholderia humisilvae TaxID=627669 RepID=A0A6J5D9G7_9BURK|nr:GMC oxidoreductase [Paraburkholderia humisilvae]CAB3749366.1 Cholesterol oxidase [Paraburkholderia humisilvae]